jgi:hypothetical protein
MIIPITPRQLAIGFCILMFLCVIALLLWN